MPAAKTSPLFHVWESMVSRCTRPRAKDYHRYGGRGITVCDRWRMSIWAFSKDMGPRPSAKHQIDRIDNSKGYCPENCRWATNKQNCNNKRTNRLLTHNGRTMTLTQWAETIGMKRTTLRRRLSVGMSVQAAIETPLMKIRK